MPNKNGFLKFVLLVGDVILMYSVLLLTLAIRYGDFSFLPGSQSKVFLFHFTFIYLFWLLVLFLLDFYDVSFVKNIYAFFQHLIIFVVLAGGAGGVYFYITPSVIAPKTILALDVLIFSFFLFLWRYSLSQILKFGNFGEKIIIIGNQPEIKEFSPDLLKYFGYELSAVFNPELSFDVSEPKKIIEKEKVNSIIFDLDSRKNKDLISNIFSNFSLKLNFISFPSFYESITKKVPLGAIDELWFLENVSKSEKRIDEILKRGFDIVFSFLGLLITAFLFSFIVLLIKVDSPGPVFYSQKRVGKAGKIFAIYKFRTMKVEAEENGPRWAVLDDPRINRVGKILRKLYIDEFPQFFNILKGDISFVGPRPERPEFVSRLKEEIPYYEIRHLIKPGFTGWAQINYHYGASFEEAKEKLQYDLYYIKNRSFLLDLGIILKTIRIIFK